MSRHDQDPEIRGFYFASSGRDIFDGATRQRPKRTPQAAIDATANLSPVPSLLNQAQVSAAQGGSFSEGFVLPGFVSFDAMNAIFSANQAVSITLGEAQICRVSGVRNSNNNSTCFLINGQSLAGVQTLFCAVVGDDSIGFEIKGTSEGVFVTCDRLTVDGDRSIGLKITGDFVDPVDIDGDVILLDGDDAVFVDFNPTNALDTCVIDISSVFSAGATVTSRGTSSSTAYIVRSGHLTIQGSMLISDIAIEVKSGAEADLRQETAVGNIIVDSGGILNVDILNHEAGTVTVNGVINGQIGNTFYAPKTFTNKDPDTTALLTHSVTGTNGGDSRTFYTTRDPKTNITGNPGDIAIRNNGEDSRFYQHRGASSNNTDWVNISDSKREIVLRASSFVNQVPTGLDTALQVTFGAAQGSGSDPVQIDASGNITINETGEYFVDVVLQYGRNNAGNAAWLFFRVLIDGTQVGDSIFAKLDTANNDFPAQLSTVFDFTATQIITVEFIRDSQGFNDGDLMTENPTAAGWNDSPSASIRISRRVLL